MQPRNPTKIAVGNHGPMDWNNCSSVYNDQPDCKGGGVFPGKIVFPTVYRSEIWVLPVEI